MSDQNRGSGQPTVHVVGAGVSGLAAALRLATRGQAVRLYDGAKQAGGRCRSYHDAALDRLIDNGNHLMLSGNHAIMTYLGEAGADPDQVLEGPDDARFPFLDVRSGQRWQVRPNAGLVPWWIFDPSRRIPGTKARDYLSALSILKAGASDRVTDVVSPDDPLYDGFWAPFTIGVLNAAPDEAAANLLRPVLMETFGRGARACKPRWARDGLSQAMVDPCLAALRERGVPIQLGWRLKALERAETGSVTGLCFADQPTIALGPTDRVILALPAMGVAALCPELTVPSAFRAIVNAHFRLDGLCPNRFDQPLGILGGTAEWIFLRGDVLSVTVSAADALAQQDHADIARLIWADCCAALSVDPSTPLPIHRVVKEKRATFAQTPEQVALRPKTDAPEAANMVLAGDWTDTGLPATIEGSIRSGHAAAQAAMRR